MNKTPKVTVIGAGLAGLTTAYRLHQAGIQVEIYEGRKRVGGRILSVQLNNGIGELGGQNIADGGESLNILRLIKEFNLSLTEDEIFLNAYFCENQQLISLREILKQKQFDPKKLKDHILQLRAVSSNMKEILDGLFSPNDPLYKILSTRLHAYEGGPIEKLSTDYSETLYQILLGGIAYAHQGKFEEENSYKLLTIKNGNALLPQKISEKLLENLHLGMRLIKVSKSENEYFLTFDNGQTIQTDLLVLAIPCSIYNDIHFENKVIPFAKLNKIKNIPYGKNSKVLIPFLKPSTEKMSLIHHQLVCFFNGKSNLLTLYYSGPNSSFNQESLKEIIKQDEPIIKLGYPQLPSITHPQFAEDIQFKSYQNSVGYSWPEDLFVKGSYSYIASGQESIFNEMTQLENNEFVKTLFSPINQSLYFAGEHASILSDVPGTMEAACESGERTARIILKTYKQ